MASNLPPQAFYVINPEDEGKFDIFRIIPEVGTAALYQINAADKALAVPVIKIWRLKGGPTLRTNEKVDGPPLSDQFTSLPDFGKPVQFAERPPASIESITVKKANPGGWIMYRELDIALTVHQPNVLNNTKSDGNVIVSLLQPGNSFLLEYGWTGGRNAVLGGNASRKELEPEYNPREQEELKKARQARQQFDQLKGIGASSDQASTIAHRMHQDIADKRPRPIDPTFFGTVLNAVQQMRFSVVNYSFSITADNQIKFQIHCVEDGELEIRNKTIFEQPDIPQPQPTDDLSKVGNYLDRISDYFAAKLKDLSFSETVEAADPKGVPGQTKPAEEEFIELQDVLNTLIAMPIVRAVSDLGYGHVHLYTSVFNASAPKTNASLGGREWASMPIGNFWLKRKDVTDILSNIVHSKKQITIYNMLIQFLGLISSPKIYDLTPKGVSVPEMQVFTLFDPKTGSARIQVVDRKRYLTVVRNADRPNEVTLPSRKKKIRANLAEFLRTNHMPHFVLGHQSSFFKDAKFDVVNDELMKSIFVNRQISRTREQITTGDPRKSDANSGLPQDLLLYRSAVKGQVTVIGNFAFDLLGLVYVSFGIPKLDGIFYVLAKIDHVSRDGFYSTLTLQAEGSDPLEAGAPLPQVAEDWAKERILQASHDAFWRDVLVTRIAQDTAADLDVQAQASLTEDTRKTIVGYRLPDNQRLTVFDGAPGPGATKPTGP